MLPSLDHTGIRTCRCLTELIHAIHGIALKIRWNRQFSIANLPQLLIYFKQSYFTILPILLSTTLIVPHTCRLENSYYHPVNTQWIWQLLKMIPFTKYNYQCSTCSLRALGKEFHCCIMLHIFKPVFHFVSIINRCIVKLSV